MYRKLYSINYDTLSRDYIDTLKNFIKKSLKFENILNSCDINNYDFYISGEKEYFMNKKVMVAKFYSEVILNFLIRDLKIIILIYLKYSR